MFRVTLLFAFICFTSCSVIKEPGSDADDIKVLQYKLDQLQAHFLRTEKDFKTEIDLLKSQVSNANNTKKCGDWLAFKDQKCLKVITDKIVTEEEALKACTDLDASAELITIHTKEEQDFISDALSKFNNISDTVWIGAKKADKKYKWMDGSDISFDNWSEKPDPDKGGDCVEMSLTKSTLGKWTDMLCTKKSLTVCEKKQEMSTNLLSKAVETATKLITEQQVKIKTIEENTENQTTVIKTIQTNITTLEAEFEKQKNSSGQGDLPVGFIYVQLPKQSDPATLWPKSKWTEVTKDYAGLFFRAEGGHSAEFGKTQKANSSMISTIHTTTIGTTYNQLWGPFQYEIEDKGWTDNVIDRYSPLNSLQLFITEGENRPQNTAIKIWKRSA